MGHHEVTDAHLAQSCRRVDCAIFEISNLLLTVLVKLVAIMDAMGFVDELDLYQAS